MCTLDSVELCLFSFKLLQKDSDRTAVQGRKNCYSKHIDVAPFATQHQLIHEASFILHH